MGLFPRRKDPDQLLAEAIVKRGVRVRGEIVSAVDEADAWRVVVRFTPVGQDAREAEVRRRLSPDLQVGLDAGEPMSLSYDRENPERVVLWGNPRYRATETGAVVRVVDFEGGERSL